MTSLRPGYPVIYELFCCDSHFLNTNLLSKRNLISILYILLYNIYIFARDCFIYLVMPKTSRKKKFRGKNRWNVESTSSCGDSSTASTSKGKTTPARETASMRKLSNQAAGKNDHLENSFSYRLIELSSLLSAFQPLHQCHLGES